MTDHRISLTLYRLDEILGGQVDELIVPLMEHDQETQLKLQAKEAAGAS